jgi:hypothetical protein
MIDCDVAAGADVVRAIVAIEYRPQAELLRPC